MTSYIQLISKIEAFCNAHKQIERFDAEFGEQRPNLATESEKYPYVFMQPVSGTPNYDLNEITVEISCYDIIQKDRDNLNTIVSDCHLMLTDLFSYYQQGNDSDIIALSASQTPVNNYDLDYVAGWTMQITFELEGWCTNAIPMSPIPSGGGGDCDPVTYSITDRSGNVLYSGTVASGGSLTQAILDATATLKDTAGVTISTTSINAEGGADITAPDATYRNSDASYSGNIVSGGNLNIVDSDVNVNSTLEGSVVSVKDIDISVTDSSGTVTPDSVSIVGNTVTIDVPDSSPAPVGATLMKTGQTTSYRTGDDADLQAGRATDFFTLATNNPFGHNQRFTGVTGGYYDQTLSGYYDSSAVATTYALAFPEDILIDWSTYDNIAGTVLGYYIIKGSTATWNDAIDNSLAHTTTSYTTGWRLWNMREADNLRNFSKDRVLEYAPFSDITADDYWTSTTTSFATTSAYRRKNQIFGFTNYSAKTTSLYYKPVRTFTVSGTTLT